DTIAIFVEPLLRGLGWETLDHNQVDRAPAGPHADFELWSDGAIKKRVVGYRSGAPGCIGPTSSRTRLRAGLWLCRKPREAGRCFEIRGRGICLRGGDNGKSWRVYEFHGEQQELKCEFDLRDNPDVPTFVDTLGRRQLLRRLNL